MVLSGPGKRTFKRSCNIARPPWFFKFFFQKSLYELPEVSEKRKGEFLSVIFFCKKLEKVVKLGYINA